MQHTPPVQPAVGASTLVFEADGRRILDVEAFAATPGEVVVIRGPSGSGKTTLLSVLGALLAPTVGTVAYGSVEVDWRRPRALARLRREHVGFVFQRDRLLEPLSAAENVAAALELRGRADAGRVGELLARVGLSGHARSSVRALSGGERQRVAVARALANDPAVVLADEPTASLDAANVAHVADLLAEAAGRRRAVVVATHDDRLARIATRLVSLEDGRLVA